MKGERAVVVAAAVAAARCLARAGPRARRNGVVRGQVPGFVLGRDGEDDAVEVWVPSALSSCTRHNAECTSNGSPLTKVRVVLARDVWEVQRVRLVREVGREVLERRQLLLARLAERAAAAGDAAQHL